MKKYLIIFTLAIGLLSLSSCALFEGLDKSFVQAVDSAENQLIIPRYIEYTNNDSTLDEKTKAVRVKMAKDLQALIQQAKIKAGVQ